MDLLERLHGAVTGHGGSTVALYALQGLGGVGKTQIAAEYAYRYSSEYDLVWWIQADVAATIDASIAALAPYFEFQPPEVVGVPEAAKAVREALRRGERFPRWLLIFDNAVEPDRVRHLLPDGPGDTLITSRDQGWDGVVETIHVRVFERDESLKFLRSRVRGITDSDADALAEALGDLPLALEQAAALQSLGGISTEQYLRMLKEETGLLLDEGRPAGYELSVAATFRLSIEHLRDRNADAVDVLKCCAFFGPQPIPRDALSEGSVAVGAPLSRTLGHPLTLAKAATELAKLALVTTDLTNRTLQVHRLLQAVVREECSDAERTRFRAAVHTMLAATASKDPENPEGWPRYRDLLPHIEASEVVRSGSEHARFLIRTIVRYLYLAGDAPAAVRHAEDALRHWSADPDPRPEDLAAMRRHYGVALRDLGQYVAASAVNSEALDQAKAAFGPRHKETLRLTNSHAADLRATGDFPGALALDTVSVKLHREELGERDDNTLRALNNLAIDYALNSDYPSAKKLFLEVYQGERDSQKGNSHPAVLIALNNLGRAHRLAGEYQDAKLLGEEAHTRALETLHSEHPSTLLMEKDLAIVERRLTGGTEETVRRTREVLASHQKVRGDRHPDTLAAAIALVNTLAEAGELDEAADLAVRTLDVYPQVFGDKHPYTLACRTNLALIRRLAGDPQKARDLDEAALSALTDELGPDHHYTLISAIALASDLAALGETEAARDLGRDTLERVHQVLGAEHPATLTCALNLAADLGATADAEQLRADSIAAFERAVGSDHPQVLAAKEGRRLVCLFDPPPI